MSRRRIPMIELNEVVYHWKKGQNNSQIARSLGISRPTVRKYLDAAKAAGLTREDGEIYAVIPENVMAAVVKAAKPASSAGGAVQEVIALHKEQICSWLDEPDMTAKQICRLLAEQGYPFNYSSLKRYVKKLKPDNSQRVTVRLETGAGEQAQVDFGRVDLTLGDQKKRVWAFVMTLSYSRHRFVRFVEHQDTITWLDCHIRAFEFFGGCPRTILLDNLKAGVVKADLYDPTINRAYAELERHYNFVADPTKVRTPEHKGKVERSVPLVRQQLVAGRSYADLAEANEKALVWCRDEVGMRPHGTTHEAPRIRFERD